MKILLYNNRTERKVAELTDSVMQDLATQAKVSPEMMIAHWQENYRVEIVSDDGVQI